MEETPSHRLQGVEELQGVKDMIRILHFVSDYDGCNLY
jgi:hypothetical protein